MRSLSVADATDIVASDARVLVDNYWGSFVALWRDRRDGAVRILRDPSGAVPLFRAGVGELALLFTDLDDVWCQLRRENAVHWSGVAHRLLYPQLPTRQTGLSSVVEVLPGEAGRADGLDVPQLLWSPWQFAASAAGPATLAAQIATCRTAVETVTDALVPQAPVLLELSGGLDSSILAAALDSAGADWTAVTIATPAADGDERHFAAAVAGRFGALLHTLALTPLDFDLLAGPDTRTPSPAGYGMLSGIDSAISRLAGQGGYAGLISGIGGDNVFCSLRSAAPVLDALRDRGLGQAIRTAADLRRLTGAGYWNVLGSARRYAARDRQSPDRWERDPRFLAPDFQPVLATHPWLASPRGRRAGARAHVVMLLRAHAVAAAHPRARRHIMQLPLLAQPVVETCLAIPTWRWIDSGRDRAVARAAFTDHLPALIIERRSKGRLESLLAPAYDRDRMTLRDRLGDGHLAAAGIIDRDAVTAAFLPAASAANDVYIRLLELVDAEFWLDSLA